MDDDLGYGDVAVYNDNSKIRTPNLDQMASEGMRFTDAHTSSSVCTPTRYGILTGRYNWRSRLKSNVLLANDPAEKNNLQIEFSDKVDELKALLTKYIVEGRSTAGEKQNNDGNKIWKQLWWIRN